MPDRFRYATVLSTLLTFTLFLVSEVAYAQSFSEELNPTGDPIGGGVGYSRIINPNQATYLVSTKAELLASLENAAAGDIIYVHDNSEIDMSGERDIVIPAGVTLASGRGRILNNGTTSLGALIYSSWGNGGNGVFEAQRNARITGLSFRGPSDSIGMHASGGVVATTPKAAIFTQDPIEIDNNEFWNWYERAVRIFVIDGTYVHHNYFHDTTKFGDGYGVSYGNSLTTQGEMGIVEANIFNRVRHAVASAPELSSWEARYNITLENHLDHVFDRHDRGKNHPMGPGEPPGFGGKNSIVHHNLFYADYPRAFSIARSVPDSGGEVRINDNWFAQPNIYLAGEIRGADELDLLNTSNYFISNNHFNGDGVVLPQAFISANVTEGRAPLTVTFNGGGTDPDGGSIREYHWLFGDGKDTYGAYSREQNPTYTFKEPGRYWVDLRVLDDHGIPSKVATIPITVLPPQEGYVLSAWVKDTFLQDYSGVFKQQILIDDTVVWEGDVSGNAGWQHVVVDVTSLVENEQETNLSFKLVGDQKVGEFIRDELINSTTLLYMYVDNVHLIGGEVQNGKFEQEVGWAETNNDPGSVKSRYETSDYRSGTQSFGLRFLLDKGNPIAQGTWTSISQLISLSSIQASNQQPLPDFNITSIANTTPITISFDASSSTDLDGSIESYLWNFGDGTTGTGEVVLHTYEMAGIYPITLTVTDNDGATVMKQMDVQSILLQQGWNMISRSVDLSDTSMEAILGDILPEVVLVKSGDGKIFSPEFGINDIGAWNSLEAYQILVQTPSILTISGQMINPEDVSITLKESWNMIPFLGSEAGTIDEIFAPIESGIILVKDNAGRVYAPRYGVDEIEMLQPGQGYKIYMNQALSFKYPPSH